MDEKNFIEPEVVTQATQNYDMYSTVYQVPVLDMSLRIVSFNTMLWESVSWWIHATHALRDLSSLFCFLGSRSPRC